MGKEHKLSAIMQSRAKFLIEKQTIVRLQLQIVGYKAKPYLKLQFAPANVRAKTSIDYQNQRTRAHIFVVAFFALQMALPLLVSARRP